MSGRLDVLARLAQLSLEGVGEEHSAAIDRWVAAHPIPDDAEWVPYEETWYPLAHGVLLLVEIARCAQKVATGMTPLQSLPGVEGTIGTEDLDALRVALARLEQTT